MIELRCFDRVKGQCHELCRHRFPIETLKSFGGTSQDCTVAKFKTAARSSVARGGKSNNSGR